METLTLWPDGAPGSEDWTHPEAVITFETPFPHRVLRNVTQPSLELHLPEADRATGDVVVVAPGGAFHFLALDHEGTEVAEWLVERGIAAAVLHYRVAPTPVEDADFLRFRDSMGDETTGGGWRAAIPRVIPLAVADASRAIALLRGHLAEQGFPVRRVGIMGFSAGGGVALASSQARGAERPDFVADIYGVAPENLHVDASTPPLFAVGAADDPTVSIRNVIDSHLLWIQAGQPAELHVWSRGGHGFGMHRLDLPVDGWLQAFHDWLATSV